MKLLFDEYIHPADSNPVDFRDKGYRWRRCYKLASGIPVNRSVHLFLTVAARVAPGNQHECPILHELLDGFACTVSRDWMKVLIVGRGLIEGARIARWKTAYAIDTVVPLKKNMDAYQDVMGLTRLPDFVWEPYTEPGAAPAPQADRPEHPTIVKWEWKRQQTLAAKKGLPPPQSLSPPVPQPRMLPATARGVTSWTQCPVPLTVVVNREIDSGSKVNYSVPAATSAICSAAHTRST